MIALVIASILGAVAIPAYTSHVQRGRLNAAAAQLKELRARMEQRYADERSFADPATPANCAIVGYADADSSFTFSCVLANAGQGYTWTAAGTGAMSAFTYTIDEAGIERTTELPAAWGLASGGANRFILRRGG